MVFIKMQREGGGVRQDLEGGGWYSLRFRGR